MIVGYDFGRDGHEARVYRRLYVGTSGWSVSVVAARLLPGRDEAERSSSVATPSACRRVELNSTGYRIPAEEQFQRWADQTPARSGFAVKMQAYQLRQAATFEERVRLLGERLGPIRILVTQARDEGFLTFALGSLDPALRIAFDFRHESWAGIELPENAVRINDVEAKAPFRYLRLPRAAVHRQGDRRDRGRHPTTRRERDRGLRLLPARGRADGAAVRGAAARGSLAKLDRERRTISRIADTTNSELLVRVEEVRPEPQADVGPEVADDPARRELCVDGREVGRADHDRPAAPLGLARADDLEPGLRRAGPTRSSVCRTELARIRSTPISSMMS